MAEIQSQVLRTFNPERTLQKINQGKRRTHTFSVDFKEYNEQFVGSFTVHYPSQMEKLHMGVLKSQLLGGMLPTDTITDNIATIVSTLEVVLDSKPAWFDVFSDELEYEMLEDVYMEYLNWVNSFRLRTESSNHEGSSEDRPSEV